MAGAFAAAALTAGALVLASLLPNRTAEPDPERTRSSVVASAVETEALLRGIPQRGAVLGSPEAPVTLIEYADLQCPYCAQWAQDAFPALVDEYVRPGRVRIVFRGLAFIGPESEQALRASLTAGRQGRLWNVVHLLYRNQGAENGGWVTDSSLRSFGDAVRGLDPGRMLAERETPSVEQAMAAAERAAARAGIRGTPSFEVGLTGGKLARLDAGALDASAFRPRLDALLRP